jgi:acetyl esterase/lipase
VRALCLAFHGGYWRARYGLELMDAVCDDLAARGYTAWNVEYRRVGGGGGWPATFDDVDEVLRRAHEHGAAVVTVGHSAGGHLALWAAGRHGATLAVAHAGVVDLHAAWDLGLSNHAVGELLGGSPADVPDRYASASPFAQLPLGVRQVLVHGRRDDVVPPSLSRAYAERARTAGDSVELVETDEAHFECLDPGSDGWLAAAERLP